MSRPAVFLDRDGTLNVEVHYLHRVEDFRWVRGAPEAVARLNRAGLPVVVVTNQAGVARGYYTEEAVHALHAHLQALLAAAGGHVDAFYHSPYHPDGTVPRYRRTSDCRKPGDALFRQAAEALDLDLARSFAVGDRLSDLTPVFKAGGRGFLVQTGHGASERAAAEALGEPCLTVVADLPAAVERILDTL